MDKFLKRKADSIEAPVITPTVERLMAKPWSNTDELWAISSRETFP
jgi:hypothetical protein